MLIPTKRQPDMLTPEAQAQLRRFADVREVEGDSVAVSAHLGELLAGADACLTGWGTPQLPDGAIEGAPSLRLIAHCAGSVKYLISPATFARGIVVCHAASLIADSVAEYTVLAMLMGLRRLHELSLALTARKLWRETLDSFSARQLGSCTVGLVGMGYVGRKVARLVKPFGSRILVYDPYLRPDDAANLGVESVALEALFQQSEVVSIHLPVTPETRHLIGARELGHLRNEAVFVNCSRSWVVDQAALLDKLRTGHIWAALDVFDNEPLPADSPFRDLPNVILTPHQAGHTVDSARRLGLAMVEEIDRFFRGEELRYRISPESFAQMA
jgi:phosphoglycerate dehydrogenase-like enzyme